MTFFSIHYIFKCGLHYLAVFKLFQRIIFACLGCIVYCNGSEFFSIFEFDFSGYYYRVKIKQPNIELGVANLTSNFECPNHFS